MQYIVTGLGLLMMPFMLPIMALVLLVAVLGKAKDKPAENYGDIKDD